MTGVPLTRGSTDHPAEPSPERPGRSAGAAAGETLTALHGHLEDLGLNPSEARVLIALVRSGRATAPELSKLAGVPRTNTYPVLESLAAMQLAARVGGAGPAVWSAPRQDEVIAQLEANLVVNHERQLREHRMIGARAAETMSQLLAQRPSVPPARLSIVHGRAQAKRAYDQLLAQTERELLVFDRSPHSQDPDSPSRVVLPALREGLRARVLYLADGWANSVEGGQRKAFRSYNDRPVVEWRVAQDILMDMAVSDSRQAVVSFPEPDDPDRLGLTLVINDAAYASLHAAMFEVLWASARSDAEFLGELEDRDGLEAGPEPACQVGPRPT